MNLFEISPTRQLDIFRQKLEILKRAGVTGTLAQKLALREAGKVFQTSSKTGHHQLSWHFQTDLNGQKYLFKEKKTK